MEPLLILLSKTEDEILIPSKTARETLYYLREGINYAVEHKIEPYCTFKEKFIFREKRDGIEVTLRRQLHFEEPIKKLAKSQHLVMEEVTTAMEIIGAAIVHKAPKMEFPKANVEGDALVRLEKWASLNNYIVSKIESTIIMERAVINADEESGTELGEHGVV